MEGHIRPAQRQTAHRIRNRQRFSALRLHEFQAGGRRKKKIAHIHARAVAREALPGRGLGPADASALDLKFVRHRVIARLATRSRGATPNRLTARLRREIPWSGCSGDRCGRRHPPKVSTWRAARPTAPVLRRSCHGRRLPPGVAAIRPAQCAREPTARPRQGRSRQAL